MRFCILVCFTLLAGCQSTANVEAGRLVQTEQRVGADRDAHGCIGSAGYSWSESANKCVRPWEQAQPTAANPAAAKQ